MIVFFDKEQFPYIQSIYQKRSPIEVWTHINKSRMLLNQRFVTFLVNMVYILFYTLLLKASLHQRFLAFYVIL